MKRLTQQLDFIITTGRTCFSKFHLKEMIKICKHLVDCHNNINILLYLNTYLNTDNQWDQIVCTTKHFFSSQTPFKISKVNSRTYKTAQSDSVLDKRQRRLVWYMLRMLSCNVWIRIIIYNHTPWEHNLGTLISNAGNWL